MKQNAFIASIDVSTRRKRRVATAMAITLLEKIHSAEEQYQENIPENLQGSSAYNAAEETLDSLVEAICVLAGAFY